MLRQLSLQHNGIFPPVNDFLVKFSLDIGAGLCLSLGMENDDTRAALLADIEKFLADYSQHISKTRFGKEAANDHKLVDRLRNGNDLTTGKMDDVRRYLSLKRAEFNARQVC